NRCPAQLAQPVVRRLPTRPTSPTVSSGASVELAGAAETGVNGRQAVLSNQFFCSADIVAFFASRLERSQKERVAQHCPSRSPDLVPWSGPSTPPVIAVAQRASQPVCNDNGGASIPPCLEMISRSPEI